MNDDHGNFARSCARMRRDQADRLSSIRREQEQVIQEYAPRARTGGQAQTQLQRGDMGDLNFHVVILSMGAARTAAMKLHSDPPGDDTIVLFTDASVPTGRPWRYAGTAVVRVERALRDGLAKEEQETKEPNYSLTAVATERISYLVRSAGYPNHVPFVDAEEAELWAIFRAFKYAVTEAQARGAGNKLERVLLWTDSTSALAKVRLFRAGMDSMQQHQYDYVLLQIIQYARMLSEYGVSIKCSWAPAHQGIPGNETADYIAGRVAIARAWNPLPLGILLGPRGHDARTAL